MAGVTLTGSGEQAEVDVRWTDDPPTYVDSDSSISQVVQYLLFGYLGNIANEAQLVFEEVGFTPDLPSLKLEAVDEYLTQSLVATDGALPCTEMAIEFAIHAQVASVGVAVAELTLAAQTFLKNTSAIINNDIVYVNEPYTMSVIKDFGPIPTGKIMMVPIADFYEDPPRQDDPRTDCLMAVMYWNGFHLCRPILVDFTTVQDLLTAADQQAKEATMFRPNVYNYFPRFGNH